MARILFQNESLNIQSESKETSPKVLSDREILKKRSEGYLKLIKGLDAELLAETRGKEELMAKSMMNSERLSWQIFRWEFSEMLFRPSSRSSHLRFKWRTNHSALQDRRTSPDHFEKARTLAKHNAYAFVEVFKDKLILIREDGTATKL
jgi:hypothetical protein